MATLSNSFYGGRRGASFVIAKNFLDILSMTQAFSQGNDYTEVAFDEYVLINNPVKNHPDNGKIFKRGYDINSGRKILATVVANNNLNFYPTQSLDYSHENIEEFKNLGYSFRDNIEIDASGAVYVGTIIGPAGKSPQLVIEGYETVQNMQPNPGFESLKSHGQLELGESLVPGKSISDNDVVTYNDTIQYYACSVRNEDYTDDTVCHIGFKVPYLVTEWTTKAVKPYNSRGEYADTSNITEIETEDEEEHPFYKKYEVSIPKGIKGQSMRGLGVLTEADALSHGDLFIAGTSQHYQESGNGNKKIFVYEYINYDNSQNGKLTYYYLGDFDQIENVVVNDDGTLTIRFSSREPAVFDKRIKWISSVSLAPDKKLSINYNTGVSSTITMPFVDNILYNSNTGALSSHKVGDQTNELLTNIQYVNRIQKGSNGKFLISYNTDTPPSGAITEIPFKEVKELGYISEDQHNDVINGTDSRVSEEDDGRLYVKYTNNTIDFLTESPLINIQDFSFDGGTLRIKIAGQEVQEFYINPPTAIHYDLENADLRYTLYSGRERPIGKLPLLVGLDVGSDLNLYAKFNMTVTDTETWNVIKNLTGDDGNNTTNPHDSQHKFSEGWFKIGNVQHVTQPLIFSNMTLDQLNTQIQNYNGDKSSIIDYYPLTQNSPYTAIIAVLNFFFPTGILGNNITGRAITIGDADQQKDFYGFNYHGTPRSWYFLGRIEKNDIIISENENINNNEQSIFRTVLDICDVSITVESGIQSLVSWTNNTSHIQAGKNYINHVTISPSLSPYIIGGYETNRNGIRNNVNNRLSYNPITKLLEIENVQGDLEIVIRRG